MSLQSGDIKTITNAFATLTCMGVASDFKVQGFGCKESGGVVETWKISQDPTQKFWAIQRTSSMNFLDFAQAPLVTIAPFVDASWETVSIPGWTIVKNPDGISYRIKPYNGDHQGECAGLQTQSANPADGTPITLSQCLDIGGLTPQDWFMF